MKKLVRITTVPLSLEKLLEDQLSFMSSHFEVVAVSSDKERLQRYGIQNNVRTFYLPLTRKINPIQDLLAVYKLYTFLRKECPAIVHSHTPKAGIVGMMAAWLAGVPLRLHTIAGLPLLESHGYKRKILILVEKLTSFFATNIYPNSFGLEKIVSDMKLASHRKIKVIGQGSTNGINLTYYTTDAVPQNQITALKNELSLSPHDFVLVFVGRVVKDKGVNELVYAFKSLSIHHSNLRLIIVGEYEPDLNDIQAESKFEIQTNPQIKHVGFKQDIRPYLAVSNLLVFPSYREGFPNAVLQALAMGLPAIVSDINGCNEIIKNHVNGLIIPPKSAESIIKSVESLINNPDVYGSLAAATRNSVLVYDRNVVLNNILDEYRTLMKFKGI